MAVLFHLIVVIAQVVDVQQAVHGHLEDLHETAELDHRRDEALEGLADALTQIAALEVSRYEPVGFIRPFLEPGGALTQSGELGWLVERRGRAARADQSLECAMHHQVGIAADRRGEVRVVLQRQSEVPDVGGLVYGLGHSPDDERFDERALRGVTQPSRNGLQVPRRDRLGQPCVDVERAERAGQPIELFGLGLTVNPV